MVKKTFVLLLTALMCVTLLASCARSKKNTVYIIGTTVGGSSYINYSPLLNSSYAMEFGPSIFEDHRASQTAQATVMGTTYSGHYMYSDRGPSSTLIRDCYNDDAGNRFTIIRSNGKLAGFYRVLTHDETSPIVCTIDEGREIATDFLKDITDIENYTLASTRSYRGVFEDTVCEYAYHFVRMLGEYETSDQIFIYIDCRRACIHNYFCYSISEFENTSLPSTFDFDNTLSALCAGTRDIWNQTLPFSTPETSIQQLTFQAQRNTYTLVKTSNGHLALSTTVEVSGIGDDGRTEAIGAVIIID